MERFLAIILAMGCTIAFAKNTCSPSDNRAINQSIHNYVKNKTAVSSDDLVVDKMHCVGSYSSAHVVPKNHHPDAVTVYLHKDEHGEWAVMSLGTHFDQDFLNQLPKELR